MRRIITGATGLIGQRLVERWLKQGHELIVIGRSKAKIAQVFGERVKALSWDTLLPSDFDHVDVVVNLAGASVGAKRWTKEYKQEILSSRITATTQIANILAKLGAAAPRLFNASAVGVYGLQVQEEVGLPARFDEISALEKPSDFLAQVGQAWEKAAGAAGDKVVFLRFGVVLAKEGGALPKMMQPFQYYLGGPVGTGKQPLSWVGIDDVIHAIDFLVSKPDVSGPFNIVSPKCVTQKEFAQTLAHVMNRPAFFPMPAFVLKLMLGNEMANDLLLEGQHVYPLNLLDMGFKFSYPDLESALNRILR